MPGGVIYPRITFIFQHLHVYVLAYLVVASYSSFCCFLSRLVDFLLIYFVAFFCGRSLEAVRSLCPFFSLGWCSTPITPRFHQLHNTPPGGGYASGFHIGVSGLNIRKEIKALLYRAYISYKCNSCNIKNKVLNLIYKRLFYYPFSASFYHLAVTHAL